MSKIQWGGIITAVVAFCLLILPLGAVPLLSSSFFAGIAGVTNAPIGYDPLTAQEVDAVVAAVQGAAGAAAPHAATAEEPLVGQEVLLVERHEAAKDAYAKGSWPRQGDVYVYDYATDTLIHTTVDVQSGAVITVERVQGVQLPLTEHEEAHALALIEADATLWTALAARYQTIMGESLQGLAQLQVKISVFHADVMPDRLNAAAQQCGQHRCAQVLIFTVDKTLLEIMPIVDLSQGQVVQVLEEE